MYVSVLDLAAMSSGSDLSARWAAVLLSMNITGFVKAGFHPSSIPVPAFPGHVF